MKGTTTTMTTTEKPRTVPEWVENAVAERMTRFNGETNSRTHLDVTDIRVGCCTRDAGHNHLYADARLKDLSYPVDALRDIAKRLDYSARSFSLTVTMSGKINGVQHDGIGAEVTVRRLDERVPWLRVEWMSYQFTDTATDNAKQVVYSLARDLFDAVFGGRRGDAYKNHLWAHHVAELRGEVYDISVAATNLFNAIRRIEQDAAAGNGLMPGERPA